MCFSLNIDRRDVQGSPTTSKYAELRSEAFLAPIWNTIFSVTTGPFQPLTSRYIDVISLLTTLGVADFALAYQCLVRETSSASRQEGQTKFRLSIDPDEASSSNQMSRSLAPGERTKQIWHLIYDSVESWKLGKQGWRKDSWRQGAELRKRPSHTYWQHIQTSLPLQSRQPTADPWSIISIAELRGQGRSMLSPFE